MKKTKLYASFGKVNFDMRKIHMKWWKCKTQIKKKDGEQGKK